MRTTVPVVSLSDPERTPPVAMAVEPTPTGIAALAPPGEVDGRTVPSTVLATHTDPNPTTTPPGAFPTSIVGRTLFVSGVDLRDAAALGAATHSDPAPNAEGRPGRRRCRGSVTWRVSASTRDTVPSSPVRDPYRAGAPRRRLDRDRPRSARTAHRCRDRSGPRRSRRSLRIRRCRLEHHHRDGPASSRAPPSATSMPPRRRRRSRPPGPGRRGLDRRVVGQDRALELLELGARLEPELLRERAPRSAVGSRAPRPGAPTGRARA